MLLLLLLLLLHVAGTAPVQPDSFRWTAATVDAARASLVILPLESFPSLRNRRLFTPWA
jgi:hypothetical protein